MRIYYQFLINLLVIIDSRVEEKKLERDEELVLDGGFVVPKSKETDGFDAPDINFLGHSFRFVFISLATN